MVLSMSYDYSWIFPIITRQSIFWKIFSTLLLLITWSLVRIVMTYLNEIKVYNKSNLQRVFQRPKGQPLITIANHESYIDDPGMWACLNLRSIFHRRNLRWTLAAHNTCFTNVVHSYIFMLTKYIPVNRGIGLDQPAINFAIKEVLGKGYWLHLFPEGRINITKEYIRFKWGIGHIIYTSPKLPVVVPIWHHGMDEVLPTREPYYIRTGKTVTLNFGEPIYLNDMLQELKMKGVSDEEARECITQKLQTEMEFLKAETESLQLLN